MSRGSLPTEACERRTLLDPQDLQRTIARLCSQVLESAGDSRRLLLLGTAGTGKTYTVQTTLQELRRLLAARGVDASFVKVAAPTGPAAFNLRFNATTIHRFIHHRNMRQPPFRSVGCRGALGGTGASGGNAALSTSSSETGKDAQRFRCE